MLVRIQPLKHNLLWCNGNTIGSGPIDSRSIRDKRTKNKIMEKKDLINYLENNCWRRRWRSWSDSEESKDDEWEYERSYADFTYDTLYIDGDRVNLYYNDIGWGYTNYESYDFTFDEFVSWWDGRMNW
jgi:hypothetical protein